MFGVEGGGRRDEAKVRDALLNLVHLFPFNSETGDSTSFFSYVAKTV